MTVHSDPRSAAIAYIDAVGHKQFDRLADMLHADVQFLTTGPTIVGRQAFVDALRRLSPIIVRNDVRDTIVDGENVAVVYDFVTDTPAGAVPTIEWLCFEGGSIKSSRLIFHKERWPEAAAELARRVRPN
jgi:hypothetical protein